VVELTELRAKDLDLNTGVVTVSRTVVELTMKNRPDGQRFLVKDYPKDREWRRLGLTSSCPQGSGRNTSTSTSHRAPHTGRYGDG
jgi:hypothetical protein